MNEIVRRLKIVDSSEKALFDDRLIEAYHEYLHLRIRFLLQRFERFRDFPGVHTGYNSITGEEFPAEELFSYSWINGRGACVFARFARHFPRQAPQLTAYARHVVEVIERHLEAHAGRLPFRLNPGEAETLPHSPSPQEHRSYSDLYGCLGLLEYGALTEDAVRIEAAKRLLHESLEALESGNFLLEPDPTFPDRISENPWSAALDLANEFAKQLSDQSYLDVGARLAKRLLDTHYLPQVGALAEYVRPEGGPFVDPEGRLAVDPGHAVEFAGFALEFARLAQQAGIHGNLCMRINDVCPRLASWNIEKGWNKRHPGIYKSIDADSGDPINDTMPWWILPETMLTSLLAFESTGNRRFLETYRQVNNTYFTRYLNPKTSLGPFQNIDGKTGLPIDVPPACKFQDPEFHSGKNILACVRIIKRLAGRDGPS
ncbi:MAG: AGE family epimerase/isomerase [Pirellulales bacterium]|nr:AGE family epimerase/isomerase [Pirellulales bacterium]